MEAILFFADSTGRSVTAAAIPAMAAPAKRSAQDSTAMPAGATTIDEQQFQLLYDATARPIHAYLIGVTGQRDIADDVLQETYFRFLSRHPAGLPPAESRPYLFRIATNLLRDRWRARHEAQWPEGFDPGHVHDHANDVDMQLDIRQVMEALKPRERQLLWLAYVEGMSHQEIAAATGLAALSIRPRCFAREERRQACCGQKGRHHDSRNDSRQM
jgi:RNA polymerase sigma-70 factor, ECF subfamily